MQQLLRWQWPRERTFWWLEPRFLAGKKKWLLPYGVAASQHQANGDNLNESGDDISKGVILCNWEWLVWAGWAQTWCDGC